MSYSTNDFRIGQKVYEITDLAHVGVVERTDERRGVYVRYHKGFAKWILPGGLEMMDEAAAAAPAAASPPTPAEASGQELRYLRESSTRSALEWIDAAIENYERCAAEMRRYRQRFVDAELRLQVDAFGWAVGFAQQANSNIRFDLAAKYGAELGVAYRLTRDAGEPRS